jgi:Domain of unknown function (DUF4105)
MGTLKSRSTAQPSNRRTALRLIGAGVAAVVIAALLSWSVLAIYYSNLPGQTLRSIVASAFGIGTLAVFSLLPNRRRSCLWFSVALSGILVWWFLIPPSNERDWVPEHARTAHATFNGDLVTVHDIRNFDYRSEEDFEIRYYDKTFNLDDLTSVDFALSYWDGNTDIAHFIVSFGFRDQDYLAVSVETRREVGEAWSTVGGFFKQYELILILGDERDLLRLRTNFRKEDVYLYRTVLTPEEGRAIFLNFLRQANRLHETPRFYNTITDNCMISLLPDFQAFRKDKGFDFRLLANGLSDRMAYENGMLASELSFADLKRRYHVNQYVADGSDAAGYSRLIRPDLQSQ